MGRCPSRKEVSKHVGFFCVFQLTHHSLRWLYRLILGIDANFRLKRKNVSSERRDPSLNNGCAYFVEETKYKEHLAKYSDLIVQLVRHSEFSRDLPEAAVLINANALNTQPSTCSNHNAVNAERSMKGLAATGVGTVDCARHDIKRPNAVGDLQKGERYVVFA